MIRLYGLNGDVYINPIYVASVHSENRIDSDEYVTIVTLSSGDTRIVTNGLFDVIRKIESGGEK